MVDILVSHDTGGKVAKEIYTTEEVELLDGTEVTLRPLSLSNLRKFMKRWNKYQNWVLEAIKKEEEERPSDDEFQDQQFEAFLDLAVMCLGDVRNDRTDKEFRKYLEDVLDEHTVVRVLYRCGGLSINQDPNQLNPAGQAGTT